MAKIYGYSDDLLVVEESDFEEDEINCFGQDARVVLEDGTVARFHYPKAEHLAVWGCEVEIGGSGTYELLECYDEDADPASDVLTTEADVEEIDLI